jgi:tetratricopeptide (TPR) repeat protein
LAQQGQSAAALRDFNRSLVLNPGLAVASRNRAELLASLGRMNEAVRDYTSALEQLPQDAELYNARGYAWQRLGDYQRALADFDESISLAPDRPDAYTQRGNVLSERGEFDQAVSNFQQALRMDPEWADAHRSLAWLLATCPNPRFRDEAQALAAARQAVQLAPQGDSFALDALAAAHANAGQFDEAIRVQEAAIARTPPDMAEPLKERLALYQQGQPYRSGPAAEVQRASHAELSPPPPSEGR